MWGPSRDIYGHYPDHKEFVALVEEQKLGNVSDEDMLKAIKRFDIAPTYKLIWTTYLTRRMETKPKANHKEVI